MAVNAKVGGARMRTGRERGRARIDPKRVEMPTKSSPGKIGSVSGGGARDFRRAVDYRGKISRRDTRIWCIADEERILERLFEVQRRTFDSVLNANPAVDD
jgi:hypothetical protein